MKTTNLILIPLMILAFAGFGPTITTAAAQRYDLDQNYSQDQQDLPGMEAGRGPSFSSPQVEPSPWGGRESNYPPYHYDPH